jgi:tRNA(fMet)-specific endonuclease VapC
MPPVGRYLLDTNILIAVLAGDPAATAGLGGAAAAFLPTIALGELYYGALKSGRPVANTQAVEALGAAGTVLPCGLNTARRYGELKALLRARGTPIPENDIWIAALAREHDLTLATRDIHFAALPELPTVPWD